MNQSSKFQRICIRSKRKHTSRTPTETIPTSRDRLSLFPGWLDYRAWLLALLFVILAVPLINETFLINPDSARYLIWAKSLASFQGFKDFTTPFPQYYVPHAPLYSLALAPFVAIFPNEIFPNEIVAAKWATVLAGAFLVALFFLWTSKNVGKAIASGATLILLSHPLFVLFGTQILSDVPFLLIMVVAFLLCEKCISEERSDKYFYALMGSAVASVFMREVGWALVIALCIVLLLRRRGTQAALIFLAPVALSVIWFFRNEILVAPLENPALRKVSVYISNFHTLPGAPIIEELWARTVSNLSAYGSMLGSLTFFSEYSATALGLLPPDQTLYASVSQALPSVTWLLVLIPFGLFLYGAIAGFRDFSVRFLLLFLGLYFVIILVYPFVDVRLLIVPLVPILSISAIGLKMFFLRVQFSGMKKNITAIGVSALIAACTIPNLVWVYSYASLEFQRGNVSEPSAARNPGNPLLPYRAVGEWIERNAPKDAVIASWRKEMALWIGERKMVHLQVLMLPDVFAALLRDGNISFIVSVVGPSGLRDVETELALCRTKSFRTVLRVADFEIIEITELGGLRTGKGEELTPTRQREARNVFREGLLLVHSGKTQEAANRFEAILEWDSQNAIVMFYCAVALGMGGNIDEAKPVLHRLKQFSQTSFMIGQVHYHEQLMERRQTVVRIPFAPEKAKEYLSMALDYWYIGYRNEALKLLSTSYQVDSLFTPTLEAAAYFLVIAGDTPMAKRSFERLRELNPSSFFVAPLSQMFEALDRMSNENDPRRRAGLRLPIVKEYLQFALREQAFDELHIALKEDPVNIEVLEMLSNLYLIERTYAPAMVYLQRLLAIDPARPFAQQKLDELRTRQ